MFVPRQYICFPPNRGKSKKKACKYHEIRPRLASLVLSLLGPDKGPTFLFKASPHCLAGTCFVVGEISLCAIKRKTFLPLPMLEISTDQIKKALF